MFSLLNTGCHKYVPIEIRLNKSGSIIQKRLKELPISERYSDKRSKPNISLKLTLIFGLV